MNSESIALVRFDYVLGHDTDYVKNNFEEIFGEVDTSLTSSGVRGNELSDVVFYTEVSNEIRQIGLFNAESVAIRIRESTDAVTEIISVAYLNKDVIKDTQNDIEELASDVEYEVDNFRDGIRDNIPGETEGPETTLVLIKPDGLPGSLSNGPDNIARIETDFFDGVESQFLHAFGAGAKRGTITLREKITLFLTSVQQQPYGTLIGIDVDGILNPPNDRGVVVTSVVSGLSTLYAVHYWCAVRGKSLDEFDDRIRESNVNLPTNQDIQEQTLQQLDLGQQIYQIQQDWGTTCSEIASEYSQLERVLEHWDPDYEATDLRASEQSDILQSYHDELQNEIDNVEFDAQRVHQSIDSISSFLDNQLTTAATRESIELQQTLNTQIESTNTIQNILMFLTGVLVILTLILAIDALIPGGASVITEMICN